MSRMNLDLDSLPQAPSLREAQISGWLLDLYADPQGELALWVLQDERPGLPQVLKPAGGCAGGYRVRPRLRLRQSFPITFYAAGPGPRLRSLWQYLSALKHSLPLSLSRQERRDLFQPEPVTVLAVEVQQPGRLPQVFQRAARAFPDLTYYDADLLLSARHAAVYGTFPLAKLRLTIAAGDDPAPTMVSSLQVLESPWELDAPPPALRVMRLSPDCDPRRGKPAWLEVALVGAGLGSGNCRAEVRADPPLLGRGLNAKCRLALQPERALLVSLRALLRRYDPDLLLTAWGDTWLLPHLLELAEKLGLPLPLNRGADDDDALGAGLGSPDCPDGVLADPPLQPSPDAQQPILRRPERSYQAYGQVIYRGQQVLLSGRWHIDMFNAMMFHDYGLDGILETARVSALPVQQAARLSPGTGISNMQIVTALRRGVMTPWRKQQAELPKTALDLLHADQGGLVYQPIIGLHRQVAEIDFISMYPSIMRRFNVSPETTGVAGGTTDAVTTHTDECNVAAASAAAERRTAWVPELNLWVDQSTPGLVPQTLQPLLEKRIALKQRIAALPRWDPRKKTCQAQAAAHKWLLVTCFGYLGYKNARFGRIEAHQAVTAYSRECLLRAKEAAEDLGYTVLHMYVDGLWVQRQDPPGALHFQKCNAPDGAQGLARADPPLLPVEAVQPLLEEIARRTGLPIALEGIYRWVAFLPSRADARVPVANRYFGVFQDGSLKIRGLEARRGDTPPFIAAVQMGILERLARMDVDVGAGPGAGDWKIEAGADPPLQEILVFLRQELRRLRQRRVPLEQLLVSQKLSRTLEQYRAPSPAARAAAQLAAAGKSTRPGQTVRFLYLRAGKGLRGGSGQWARGASAGADPPLQPTPTDVHAWDCPPAPPPERLDIERYTALFMRACAAVLQPWGVTEAELRTHLMR